MSRGLVGFGLAGGASMFSMYSEFIPKKSRGMSLTLFQIAWTAGAILEAILAWKVMPEYGWRGLVIASSLPLSFK